MTSPPPPSTGIAWSRVRIGVVVIISLVILGYGIYEIGKLFDVFADRYELVTLVSTTTGLLEGSPVSLAGQRVGQVARIEFIPVERKVGDKHLTIHLSVSEAVREHIREDSEARIRTQGLMGDKYVDIRPGSLARRPLQPGDTLPSAPPVDIDRLLVTANDALLETQTVLTGMDRMLTSLRRGEGTLGRLLTDEELYEQLIGTSRETTAMLRQLNRSDGTLGRLIRDPALYEELLGTLARIDTIGAEILRGEGTLGRLIGSDTVYQGIVDLLSQAGRTVARADTTITGVGGFVDRLGAAEGGLQRFLSDPELYDQFLKAVIDLQTLLADIRQQPRRYRPEINIDVF